MELVELPKSDNFDPDKVSDSLDKILEILQTNKLRVGELIILYGMLGYSMGLSIEGVGGMSIEELQKKYYAGPTVGVSMAITGLTVSSWFDGYMKVLEETIKSKEKPL